MALSGGRWEVYSDGKRIKAWCKGYAACNCCTYMARALTYTGLYTLLGRCYFLVNDFLHL